MIPDRIDILCRVIDNYGDIGFAFRLAKDLSALAPELELRIVTDNIPAFALLEPRVLPSLPEQRIGRWLIVDWNVPSAEISLRPPGVVLEVFACGRPDWYEEILFSPAIPEIRRIVNVEYLTAEPWAEEHHRMKSGTRSALVMKDVFMPGFTPKTGGLLIDPEFRELLSLPHDGASRPTLRRALLPDLPQGAENRFWIPVFTYERSFAPFFSGVRETALPAPPLVLAAAGKSAPCVRASSRETEAYFLPFLRQHDWDTLLALSDFLIVRGEESLSRASLSGIPFLWHAYLQEDRHQNVKVRALLDRMRPHFAPEPFTVYECTMIAFNDREVDSPDTRTDELWGELFSVLHLLVPGFADFARELRENGDLGEHLLSFIREIW